MQAITQILCRSSMLICLQRFQSFLETAPLQPSRILPVLLKDLKMACFLGRQKFRLWKVHRSEFMICTTVELFLRLGAARQLWEKAARDHLHPSRASCKIRTCIPTRLQASRRSAWNVWLQLPPRLQGDWKLPYPNDSRWTSKTGGTIHCLEHSEKVWSTV